MYYCLKKCTLRFENSIHCTLTWLQKLQIYKRINKIGLKLSPKICLTKVEMMLFKNSRIALLKRFIALSFCCDASSASSNVTRLVTLENMNEKLKKVDYAVRGPVLVRANELEMELLSGEVKPFTKIIKANLGDGQAMGQPPLTFYRQILALVCYPHLMSNKSFPEDVVKRAKEFLSYCKGGSVGAYSESFGILPVRKSVAEFTTQRDKFDTRWEDILLSAGASTSIKNVLNLINQKVEGKLPGVMIPIPQYPLYTATLSEFGMESIGYYLDESTNWGLSITELTRSYNEAKERCNPRALVVINPGNPTGQVLTKDNIKEVIKFAHTNKLLILADEVYQMNIYAKDSEFHSFKKVTREMGSPYDSMELTSFMSCSKGFMGECGLRGGYCELLNFDPAVIANFTKSISASLCPTVLGQCLVDCLVRPPKEGDPSYELFEKEKSTILCNLAEKAEMVHKYFNKMEGFSCTVIQGAMYAFPKIELPPKAVEEATSKNLDADFFYCLQLLETTGICVVPGSGFRQQPGTYHFRTTILPSKEQLLHMLQTFEVFQKKFLKKYG